MKKARKRGIKAGLLRLRLIRSFPVKDIKGALKGKRAVAVIDQNISIGKGGILHSEITSCLYNEKQRLLLLSFIGGLGGKNISPGEFEFIFDKMSDVLPTLTHGASSFSFTLRPLSPLVWSAFCWRLAPPTLHPFQGTSPRNKQQLR